MVGKIATIERNVWIRDWKKCRLVRIGEFPLFFLLHRKEVFMGPLQDKSCDVHLIRVMGG